MKILIIGATRGIGKCLSDQAIESGHNVVGMARKRPSEETKTDKLTIIEGNILDKHILKNAVNKIDSVCLTIGTRPTFREVKVFSKGTRNLIEIMKEAGVKRLVCTTGIGAGDSKGHGGFLYDKIINPLLLNTIYQDKDRQEKIIKNSGLEWTVVRPARLTYGPKTGVYRAITDVKGVTASKISRADVADFILKEIQNNNFLYKTPLLSY